MFRVLISLFVIAGLAAAVMLGCGQSGGDKAIAVVGDHVITLEEFRQNTPVFFGLFGSPQEEFDHKRQLLDSLITSRLLIQAAYENNLDQLNDVREAVARNYQNFLLDVLYDKYIANPVEVTDAEVREYWDNLGFQLRASHILVTSEDTAKIVFQKIKDGADFGQTAHDYSIDPMAKHNLGDLGYFEWGTMVDEFEQTVFKMEPGEVSVPVKSAFGYHIINLVDKRSNRMRRSYKSMQEEIRQKLVGKRRFLRAQTYFNEVKQRHPITLDSSVADYVMHKRQALYPPQLLERMPKNDFDEQLLDRNEIELVLAVWDGGKVTLLDYLLEARRVLPPQSKPDFDDYDSLQAAVFEVKKSDILALEAAREGLDKSEEFTRKLEKFKERTMSAYMRNDSISKPTPPTDKDLRYHYENNLDDFAVPARIHVFEILLSDELLAQKLAMETRTFKQLKNKAAELTERPGMRAKSGDLGFIERDWFPDLFDAAFETVDGTVGGPIVAGGKYSVFMPVERVERVYREFLEVKREIEIELTQKNMREDFDAWVRDRKANTDVEIYDDVIWETVDKDAYAERETASGDQP